MLKHEEISSGVQAVLDAQWVDMRTGVLEQVEARKKQLALAAAPVKDVTIAEAVAQRAAKPVGLARVVPMVDVSGSMKGTPMNLAIGLGILASEVTHESFRDNVLTFSERPTLHDFRGEASFVNKTKSVVKAERETPASCQ